MKSIVSIIAQKELRDAMRDRRSVMMLLVMAMLMPANLALSLQVAVNRSSHDKDEAVVLRVIGSEKIPNLVRRFKSAQVTIEDGAELDEAGMSKLLGEKRVAAVLRVSSEFRDRFDALRPAKLELWSDSTSDHDSDVEKIAGIIRDARLEIASARLIAAGTSAALLRPIDLQEFDVASAAGRAGKLLSIFIGLLLWTAFSVSMNMVVDATAGERERRSLEVLLAQPATARQIMIGKWLAASLLAFFGVSFALFAMHMMLSRMPLEELGMSWRLGGFGLVQAVVLSIPLCLMAPAVELALAFSSKTIKEAQATVTFAMLVPMAPPLVVPMLDIPGAAWMYWIPILGEMKIIESVARGESFLAQPFWVTMAVELTVAAFAVFAGVRRLQSERFVLGI